MSFLFFSTYFGDNFYPIRSFRAHYVHLEAVVAATFKPTHLLSPFNWQAMGLETTPSAHLSHKPNAKLTLEHPSVLYKARAFEVMYSCTPFPEHVCAQIVCDRGRFDIHLYDIYAILLHFTLRWPCACAPSFSAKSLPILASPGAAITSGGPLSMSSPAPGCSLLHRQVVCPMAQRSSLRCRLEDVPKLRPTCLCGLRAAQFLKKRDEESPRLSWLAMSLSCTCHESPFGVDDHM